MPQDDTRQSVSSRAEIDMQTLSITHHARKRLRERALPLALVYLILQYGEIEYDGECRIIHLRNRKKAQAFHRQAKAQGINLDSGKLPYLVICGDTLITGGWNHKTIQHNARKQGRIRRRRRGV